MLEISHSGNNFMRGEGFWLRSRHRPKRSSDDALLPESDATRGTGPALPIRLSLCFEGRAQGGGRQWVADSSDVCIILACCLS